MLYEVRKLLSDRGLIIWGILILVGTLAVPLLFTWKSDAFNRNYSGEDREHYSENSENHISAYDLYLCKKSARNTGKSMPIYFDFNMEKHSLLGLNAQLEKIENTDSYHYRDLMKEKKMMEACVLVEDNVACWNIFDEWENTAVIVIFIFVLFALAGIYAKERATNTNYLLCTAKIGYLRVIADKWLAGGLLGVGSIWLVNLNLGIAFILCGSSQGYGVNIVNLGVGLVYTPYNMAIWEYMLVKILFQSIGMIFFVAFIAYFSLQSPYRYLVIFFGGILFLPQTVSYYAMGRENGGLWSILDFMYDCSLLAAIRPEHAFYKYRSFNIAGNPVNYTTIYVILLVCLTIWMGILTVKNYRKYIVRSDRC